MLKTLRARQRHSRLMRVAVHLVREEAVLSSDPAAWERITPAQVACLAFARHQLRINEEEAADYLAAALVARGYPSDHQLTSAD
ncbi:MULTISPECIES: hypothetical protein [Streptomyces]|uniref:hypothetical protein n=1 Tax=Streptomyces TaxID=1883 RepID=UPI00210AF202|nr:MULTISPECIES: hypothetical protein [Streptomyces]UUA11600.1 hypothetical protein NNW98_38980 [Streptomyces koelreuteriae]UUA19195.1 hypothetical protein NNW99_38835 [Streptomyces sp. CRCS-T-1]